MSLISEQFLLFAAALVIVFYWIPKRGQWICLLVASGVFYCAAGVENCLFILVTALSSYVATRVMQTMGEKTRAYLQAEKSNLDRAERKQIKARSTRRRKTVMIACLVLNFGLLGLFKYGGFVLRQVNELTILFGGAGFDTVWHLIVPLGISFYTFQTMGYVVDVYWEKSPAQTNFAKLLLFTSFFPQVTQGPISDYRQLAPQLFAGHRYDDHNVTYGFQRMLWGYFKKMVLADRVAPMVHAVFAEYTALPGNNVLLGAFLYSLQIYADFSGYMDIVCGLCEMLDIRLTENFLRPYFSKSIAEYWRRWHISLGAWFKTYLYYPIAISRFSKRCGKWGTKVFGSTFGKTISASLALVVVWLTTGLWHGANWGYIVWGGINGLFIIVSLWLEPVYERLRRGLRVRESGFGWRAFQTLRTFFLVTMIKVFPEVGGFRNGVGYWAHCFLNWDLSGSVRSLLYPLSSRMDYLILGGGALLLFAVSLVQRKGSVRDRLARTPRLLRLAVFLAIFFAIVLWGIPMSTKTGGFLYAQF